MGCGSSSSSGTEQSNKVKNQQDLKLNYDDFKDIDEHARQAPRSVEESIETLAKYLAKPANNDIEVVRALYVWICENIRYNTNAFFGGNLSSLDTSGKGVLTSKSSVCAGYANLLESLCQALGITCKKISGYAKGYGHNLGEIITFSQDTDHAWNAVRLEGVWRFIETTWGAGYVDKNQEFIKKFNNFYFLTSPENFIYDHFPYFNSNIEESKQWQLLEKPITIEEYAKKIKPSKEARQYGVKFSHPYVIIDNSQCTIIVESSAHPFQNCWFDFYNDKGSKCTDAAIMLCADSKECKTTVRPQSGGKYTLCLHAKIKDENTTLAEYIIYCETAESNWKPYPNYDGFYGPKLSFTERGFESFCVNPSYTCKDGKFHLSLKTSSTPEVLVQLHDAENIDHKKNLIVQQNDTSINIRSRLLNKGYYKLELFSKVDDTYTLAATVLILNTGESDWKPFPKNTGHYGPKPDFTDRGFESSCIKPFYECKDGNFRLFLKTTSTPEILVQLHDAENVDLEENLLVEQNDNSVNISSRLFNKGYYKLELFSKVDEKYTLAYTVLILNTGESDWTPFPKNSGHYGPKPDFTDRGFEKSGINPFYECKDGNFQLRLKTTSTPEVLVQLHDAENVDHKENLIVEQNDTSINIRSRLLNKGYYKLELFSKVDEKYTLAYTVLILNICESDWTPFPKNTGHYGPKQDFTNRGFESSGIKPFYECKDGNFCLFLKTTSIPEVLVQLHDAENVDHKENLIVEQNDTSINIRSRLLNKGYYKLELFSKVDDTYTLAYTVLILNTCESDWTPFPKNSGHYGPHQDFTNRGFESSCIKPFYECKDGNFCLFLKTTSTPKILVQLHDAENVDHEENLLVEQNDTSINIRSRLLNKGYYKLELLSKVDDTYTFANTVLILNTCESDWTPFPKHYGHYGPMQDFTNRGFESSGIKPFYECKDGNFRLFLKTTSIPEVLVQLHDAENVDHKENLMVEQNDTSINIRSRLLNKGYYKLELFSKVDENYTLAYTLLILNTGESDWTPFPKNSGHYGPKPDFTDRGFEKSGINPFYECKDGNFQLRLKTTSTPEVLVQLHDAENVDHKENLIVEQNDTSINIRSRLLNKGYYKLELFSKVDEKLAATVLILNTCESDWTPFPKNTGHYGPKQDFTTRGFESSGIKPFYECKDGNFCLFLKTTSIPEVLVQLHDAENVDHKENLIVEQNDTSINIRSRLLNKGYYKLELFSKVDDTYTLAYTVLILNTCESDWTPFPKNSGHYGPHQDFTNRGFESSCIKPFYECKDGNFCLFLKTTSTPKILVQLHDAENVDHEENLLVEQNDTSINIRSRLLNKGYYKLELLSKVDDTYTFANTVLILNTCESDWTPFPKHYGHYGPMQDFTNRGFESSGIKPFYECKDGNFRLFLKTTSIPEVLVQLHDAENVDHKENLMVEQNDTSINIRSRLLNKGYYKLELYSKVDENYKLAYTLLILNTCESDCIPFPKNTGHYGPQQDFTNRGFESSCIKPFYECKDGNFRLFLKTTSTPKILVQLHDAENLDHEENLLVEQNDTSINIRSRLLNKGYYKLELFSKVDDTYTVAYTVLILNTRESDWTTFPKHTGHYGPNQDFTNRGFESSGIKPFYECKDGNFCLFLKTTSIPEVLVKLHDAENVDHKENLMVEQNDTSINIRSRLLNKGYYKLVLFSKVDGKYALAYTVLILNTGESDWTPFPKYTGHYGPKQDFTDRGFEKSGIHPFYECRDGNFQLLLKTTSTPEILVQLHDAENIDHKDYIMVEQSNSSIHIRSRLLNKGYYKLDLFSKVDQKYTSAYTILIQNTVESDVISMFPKTYTATTKYKCQLFQPLVRELPPNSDICFEFDSPAFEGILANNKIKSFSEKSGEKWKVTVTTGETGELSLSGKPTGESLYWTVYTFVINS